MRKSNFKIADNSADKRVSFRVQIRGRVQGVGFRPFIYRLANHYQLKGSVHNQPHGVVVEIEGPKNRCNEFLRDIPLKAPGAAIIKQIIKQQAESVGRNNFAILPSVNTKNIITEICPDIAICDDCIRELNGDGRRKEYPFINCTNCGPRFTLILDYPYDRIHTTMRDFEMCPECRKEYENPSDRRFHAQPTSCFSCGPHYELHLEHEIITDFQKIIQHAAEMIDAGKVIAMKGLGGYNLVCDAKNSTAVKELRQFKRREKKPFAVMYRSLEDLKKICRITPEEASVLNSWRKPIVILDQQMDNHIALGISAGLNSLGVFLPYLPIQHLLFNKISTEVLVVTSGNESDIPILFEDSLAIHYFKSLSGGILTNNRIIARRADDSVVKIIDRAPHLIRRARGYVPAPVDLKFSVEGILATGAELSNTFCLGKDIQAIFSQHIGDLKNMDTYEFYTENIENFKRMYRFLPDRIACDLHPDYLSTQFAEKSGLPRIPVQHHHAHIAAVMAEYGLDSQVMGLAYDGTGLGSDHNIWGSEILVADYRDFRREGHFEYIPLPGGDMVTREPWRTGISYLYKTFGRNWKNLDIPMYSKIDLIKANNLTEAIDKQINCPLSCSAGRLFDAIAAILGICTESNYHAEAPLLLENYLSENINDYYPVKGDKVISFSPAIYGILEDLKEKRPLTEIVTKFHNTIAQVAFLQVQKTSQEHNIRKIVLGGGTFQNKYLTEKLLFLLRQNDFETYFPREISCNDGGIALGQLAVAAHKK